MFISTVYYLTDVTPRQCSAAPSICTKFTAQTRMREDFKNHGIKVSMPGKLEGCWRCQCNNNETQFDVTAVFWWCIISLLENHVLWVYNLVGQEADQEAHYPIQAAAFFHSNFYSFSETHIYVSLKKIISAVYMKAWYVLVIL